MRVSELHLQGFTKHKNTRLRLPEKGIVVITGHNGSGKSSVVEAVAFAGWGDTLRGANPWQEGRELHLELTAAEVSIVRQRSTTGKNTLNWASPPTSEWLAYETVTKAQQALEAIIGPFNVWRRTCVFSSQDAAHFTMSTDSERKRLLEAILNLSRFDAALERCKVAKKGAEEANNQMTTLLVGLKAQLESERLRVRDAESIVANLPAPVDLREAEAKLSQLAANMKNVSDEIAVLAMAQRKADQGVAVAEASVREANRRLAALNIGDCDKCGQPIPQALVDRLFEDVLKAQKAAEHAKVEADKLRQDCADLLAELGEERDTFQTKHFELQAKVTAERTNAVRRKQAEQMLAGAKQSVEELEKRINNGAVMVKAAEDQLAVLTAVEFVLGMKGVRAHVLGKTLAGLEAVANSWLARIAGPGLTLTMKPYSEKKTGGVSDAISLEVVGAGGGHGYKAASGGERRRIDVALLLALAEVAQAAHGRGNGSTLFFDECMDSLDRDGIVAVSAALRDLAQDRCVVVITHDPDLLEELRPAQHFVANGGTLDLSNQ